MKTKQIVEYRYYNIPENEYVLPLLGDDWRGIYGNECDPLHFHNLMEIGICHEGSGYMILDTSKVHYSEECITIIPANYPHVTVGREKTVNYWEYLFIDPEYILNEVYGNDNEFINKMLEKLNKTGRMLAKSDEDLNLRPLIRILFEECRNRKNYSNEVIKNIITSIIIMISRLDDTTYDTENARPDKSKFDKISAALEYIKNNYMNDITIDTLSNLCFISNTHFRRLFEECMNMSPLEYTNFIRVKTSCNLLQKSKYSMDEVAFRCGFNTFSTFNRNFKKIIGITPYQYRMKKNDYKGKIFDYKITAKKGWDSVHDK